MHTAQVWAVLGWLLAKKQCRFLTTPNYHVWQCDIYFSFCWAASMSISLGLSQCYVKHMAYQLSNGTALCSAHADGAGEGGQSTLLFCHHCYDYRAAYLNPHMIHKTQKIKKKGIRKDHPNQSLQTIGFSPRRRQNSLFLRISPKQITQTILFFKIKITQAKEQNIASHLHTRLHCQPWRYWQSTSNTASPMINECEHVPRSVRDHTCKREWSSKPKTTTMHGLNQEVD